jgi:hypothetical protein
VSAYCTGPGNTTWWACIGAHRSQDYPRVPSCENDLATWRPVIGHLASRQIAPGVGRGSLHCHAASPGCPQAALWVKPERASAGHAQAVLLERVARCDRVAESSSPVRLLAGGFSIFCVVSAPSRPVQARFTHLKTGSHPFSTPPPQAPSPACYSGV